jgi:ribosomal-protein-alanine N-acetyltransferase
LTTIETERLMLRPFTASDIAAYAAIRAKPEVVRHLPGGPGRAAEARAIAERLLPQWAGDWGKIGYAPWAAVEKASGRLLGHLGLRRLEGIGAGLDGETEILYMLDDAAWGRGLASEGARAARDFGFARVGLPRLVALARPENVGSVRVMQRIGLDYEGAFEAFGLTGLRFGMSRTRWEGQGAAASGRGPNAAWAIAGLERLRLGMPPGRAADCRRFYVWQLGMLELAPQPGAAAGSLWLRSSGLTLVLEPEAGFAPSREPRSVLRASDLAGLVRRLGEAGCEVEWRVGEGGARRCFVSDPVGNVVEVVG